MRACALPPSIAQLFADARRAGQLPSSCTRAPLTSSIFKVSASSTAQLHDSLTHHTFPTTVAQLFHVAHGWLAEDSLVFTGEVRGISIPDAGAGACGVEAFAKHESSRLLKPQLLLEL